MWNVAETKITEDKLSTCWQTNTDRISYNQFKKLQQGVWELQRFSKERYIEGYSIISRFDSMLSFANWKENRISFISFVTEFAESESPFNYLNMSFYKGNNQVATFDVELKCSDTFPPTISPTSFVVFAFWEHKKFGFVSKAHQQHHLHQCRQRLVRAF